MEAVQDKGKSREGDSIESSSLTYTETTDAILQFLEITFHTVLYMRNVYPPEVFKLHKFYSLPVYRSRHPGLNEYITGILASIRHELEQSKLKKIILVISSFSTGAALERYIFEVEFLLAQIRKSDRDLSIRDNLTFTEVSLCFKSLLLKLGVLDSSLEDVAPLQNDLTFAVVLEMQDGTKPGALPSGSESNRSDEGAWVPAQMNSTVSTNASGSDQASNKTISELRARRTDRRPQESSRNHQDAIILPVRSFDSGVINLMLYVEDNPDAKSSLRGGSTKIVEGSRHQGNKDLRRRELRGPALANATTAQLDDMNLNLEQKETHDQADIEEAILRDGSSKQSSVHQSKRAARKRRKQASTTNDPASASLDAPPSGLDRHQTRKHSDEKRRSTAAESRAKENKSRPDSDDLSTPSESESRSDTSERSRSSGDAHSDGTDSEDSIHSVGDFAGFGGAGAGRGGGGMTAGW
ncbi:unnamed protein product [Sympodiomycopsis kandeliae]